MAQGEDIIGFLSLKKEKSRRLRADPSKASDDKSKKLFFMAAKTPNERVNS